ncbi:hypothetical protein EV178_002552 [Coemansia sp. RSA 1646]|nr:hypothetical protein EV178_002552 [Coemansia sp. RSA 1646]
MADNISVLTKGHKTYAKKRKARREQVEEVQFDPEARRTFLTGFHKRKVERQEQARALARQREREERLEMRRENRQAQKEHLAHKIMLNKGIDGELDADKEKEANSGSDEESEAEKDAEEENVLHGDTTVTTVTVTRDFDPTKIGDSDLRLDAKLSAQEIALNVERDALKTLRRGDASSDDDADGDETKSKSVKQDKKKKKPTKKFRYETKAKRATTNKAMSAAKKKKGAMSNGGKTQRRR